MMSLKLVAESRESEAYGLRDNLLLHLQYYDFWPTELYLQGIRYPQNVICSKAEKKYGMTALFTICFDYTFRATHSRNNISELASC